MRKTRLLLVLVTVVSLALAQAPAKKAAPAPAPKAAAPAPKAAPAPSGLVDINTASLDELKRLPAIGDAYAQKIIQTRPFQRKDELVSKNVMPQNAYDRVKDLIIARQAGKK